MHAFLSVGGSPLLSQPSFLWMEWSREPDSSGRMGGVGWLEIGMHALVVSMI
uniref:Uncharacterized protein n=1 Tax=Picea glauca TaxID=3330 RepID=A0A117NIB6_PICGL|nr:hypothetical protein ABT39_MTgene2940 [Picea glauca]